jgi:hypothetical protein
LSSVVLACSAVACSSKSSEGASSPSGSEVAVSVVSGALNNNSGTGVSLFAPRAPERNKRSLVERGLAALNPIGTAYAAEWSCSGDTLTPKFAGPGSYAWAPASCKVTWLGGRSASSIWSGPFTLDYGSSCDDASGLMETQAGGCEMTRTSASGGTTRTITGPDGNSYAIDHDTDGANTGWDSSVSPAPSDGGVQITCGTGGCSASRTLVVNGSHLTGTVDIDGNTTKIWDHTVSTGSGGLSVTGSGVGRVVNGSITVQHNIIHVTSTTTFSSVEYGEPLCCFPTGGSVSTTFSKGSDVGKTESIAFSGVCGEATLTKADGASVALTFVHCL